MRRALLIVVAAVAISGAGAADPATVLDTARPLEGAVRGIGAMTFLAHLPGYGLNIHAYFPMDAEVEEVVPQVQGVVSGLAAMVRGLDAGDWVCVSCTSGGAFLEPIHVVVRMRPGDASSLETWVDGVLQN